jgi:hypothetical protein
MAAMLQAVIFNALRECILDASLCLGPSIT